MKKCSPYPKFLTLFFLIFSLLSFSSITFKGMTPYIENGSSILSNNKIIASISNEGLLENLATKDTMYDAIYNMYFTLDKKKVTITKVKTVNAEKIVAYGTNGDKEVTIEYSLTQNGIHVNVLSKESKELRVFFKESDVKPVFIKEQNYNFIQCRHIAYAIVFPNSLSMYRIGALMILSRTPTHEENYSKFDFDIIVDKDIHSLKEKLNLIDQQNKLLVQDNNGKPISNVKIILLDENTPIDVSTSNKNGEIYFSAPEGKYNYQVLNEDLEIESFTQDKIILKIPEKLEFLWKPYLTGLSTSSIYVGFKTNKPGTAAILVNNQKIIDNLIDTFHIIKIDNLTPSTTYSATILAGTSLKEQISFKTAGNEKYKFLVYGDTRTNTDRHKIICDELSKENALFVLHTGDLVESGPQLFEWNVFFDTGHSLFSTSPVFPVLGNHEHNTEYYYQAFMPPRKGGGDFLKQWYSFDIGPVHYIVLDSDIQENTAASIFQTKWLENDLKNTDKPYIIVLFHHPFFSNVKDRGQQFREEWHNLFVKYKVSAVFNGHIHHYERFLKDGVMYITTGGGGAPLGYGLYSNAASYLPFSKAAAAGYLHYVVGTVENNSIHFVVKAVGKEENYELVKTYKILDEFEIYPRKIVH
ncbi:MAG: metallophosphoesterase [Thermosipho sp. (in: Bacteria)]|nr:metallophosphoesterase [Thermosipho sp. (in: thermotogales)]